MSAEPTDQEKRSREIADKIRTYLSALHTGGIAITFAVAGTLAGQKIHPSWAVWPVLAFSVGLLVVGGSLFLAKHKAKKRDSGTGTSFEAWYWRNFTYDLLSLFTFVVAVAVGLWQLHGIRLS